MAGNRPDSADVHVNAVLTNLSIAYSNAPSDDVADKIFPLVGVNKQTDIIPVYDKAHWFRDEMQVRAPGTKAASMGWTVDVTNTYYCQSWALSHEIPDEVRANADVVFDQDRDAVALLTDKSLMRRERALVTATVGSSIWTSTGSIGAKWSDFANSDPIDDIATSTRTVHDLIGRDPNIMVMGKIVFDRIRRHPDFVDLIKYTQRGVVTQDIIAQVLNLKAIHVIKASYETAAEGATSSMSGIMDDDALLLYVPDSPSLLTPAAGYTFFWKPLTGGAPQYMRKFRLDAESTDVVEVRSYFHTKVTSADAGAYWSDCVD